MIRIILSTQNKYNGKIIFVLLGLFFLLSLPNFAQLRFAKPPLVRVQDDTTYYSLSSSSFYSYFKQRFDKVFISFDTVLFDQIGAINNKTGTGYFLIKWEKQTLIKYEVQDNKIEGNGIMFHPNLFNIIYNIPYCQSLFHNNKLDGVTCFYDTYGIIYEIVLYKKGKYKKYLYHHAVRSKKALRRWNKKATDPFSEGEIIL